MLAADTGIMALSFTSIFMTRDVGVSKNIQVEDVVF